MRIFNVLADLCQEQPNYIDAFVHVVRHCIKPFLLHRSTDAEIYSSALTAFYSDFGSRGSLAYDLSRDEDMSVLSGYLLRVPSKRVQQCILETLLKTVHPSNKSPLPSDDLDGLKPAPIDYLLRIQCNSDLCETLVKVVTCETRSSIGCRSFL